MRPLTKAETDPEGSRRLVKAIREIAHHDIDEWGTGGFGIALLERYFTDEPTVSAKELCGELHLSDVQCRRRLEHLRSEGKVYKIVRDGTARWGAVESEALRLFDTIYSNVRLPEGKSF